MHHIVAQVYRDIGHLGLMVVLLVCSAFFSGSETAFFNLTRRQIESLSKSSHKLHKLTGRLLHKPSKLLSGLLFGNMLVNILFYASGSVLIIEIENRFGVTAATLAAAISFAMILLCGEILPKSFAYANSKSISIFSTLPAYVCVKIFTPVIAVFRFLAIDPILRLLLGGGHKIKPVTTKEFQMLIDTVRKRGHISEDENQLLTEVVEFGFLKVRDCLTPRVDMIACDKAESRQRARDLMLENGLTKLPVYDGEIDNIIGIVHFRRMLLEEGKSLAELVENVNFVPEQKSVESLLEFFHKSKTDTAIVVDEYGGISGSISIEDLAEELFGPVSRTEGIEPIKQIGPLEYRLAGNLAIHDWAQSFGIDPAERRISTIAGLVTALLGRIAKTGDIVNFQNLKFTVESVRKNRVESIILTFEPIKSNDN